MAEPPEVAPRVLVAWPAAGLLLPDGLASAAGGSGLRYTTAG